MSTGEEWRPAPDYEDRYEVSSYGRVRRSGFYTGNRWGTQSWWPPQPVRPTSTPPYGHRTVFLSDGKGNAKGIKVHRLVLRAFVGEPPLDKRNGLHRDDNPANNHLMNLYWGTHHDNSVDSVANGNHTQARKRRCYLNHLLVEPNLVESATEQGARSCLACKLSRANHLHDQRLREKGRERTRYNKGRDGFTRRVGETWEQEAHRRYAHIMRDQPVR